MAAHQFSRGKKLVALCGIEESKHNGNNYIYNKNVTSNESDDGFVCDLSMIFSDDYGMDIPSSPIMVHRINIQDNSMHSNSLKDSTNNDSSALTLTDISFNNIRKTNSMNTEVPNSCSSPATDSHQVLTNISETVSVPTFQDHSCLSHDLTVPSVWFENNSINTPQLTSLLLDDQQDNIDVNIEENVAHVRIQDNQDYESTRTNETQRVNFPHMSENTSESESFTLVLNEQTGIFERVDTNLDEIVDVSLLSNNKNTNQKLRLLGKPYKGSKRKRDPSTTEVQSLDVVKKSRSIKEKVCPHGTEPKSDRSFLCSVITEDMRNDIFLYFWQLPSWEAKKAYINGLVQLRSTLKRRPNSTEANAKKTYGFDCFLPGQNGSKVRVCKSYFLATFDLKKDIFQEWIRTGETTGKTAESVPRKIRKIDSKSQSTEVVKPLKSCSVYRWLEKVPTVPSHYCRSDSSRTYVEDSFISKTNMHKVYTDWCKDNGMHAVTRKLFIEKLEAKKISIFKPRKDQCDTCVGYKEGNVPEDKYNLHIIKKNEARNAKKLAINEISSRVLVVTMDMQSVLLCPKLLVSEQYYKTKLAIHNFTFYVKNNKDVHLYVWHEGEGGVTANNITSCIIHFIQEYCTSYQKIYLISDGCTYQNKNKVLCSALSNVASSTGIEIEQLILEKGHTMMEVDSVHSTLEKQFKPPIFSPADYITRMRQARPSQPYVVNHLDYTFFKNYEDVRGNFSSIRPGKRSGDPTVNDIRGLWYKEDIVKYKLRHSESFQILPQRRCKSDGFEPKPLYDSPPKIESSKYASLQSLKTYMHKDYHHFYDNLHT